MPYFCLEFVEGGSLEGQLDGTPWPGPRAAGMVELLARAMQAAHERGIIHRDLKPANVLLTADGEPKITDFGLAKRLDQDSGQTRTGTIMGTPSYMAPEQAGGRRDIGPPADVYALGAILYELLTGRPPFNAATAVDTLEQVVSEEPVPPRRLQPAGAARPGDDLPEVPAQGGEKTLRLGRSAGGRPAPLPERRADPGAAGRPAGEAGGAGAGATRSWPACCRW